MITQNDLKRKVSLFVMEYILLNFSYKSIIGIGSGSTIKYFIDILKFYKLRYFGVVSSSNEITSYLRLNNITVLDINNIKHLSVYIDSVDEINYDCDMIKGGGGALTKEKILASISRFFICISDISKFVSILGNFSLPLEIIPMSRNIIKRYILEIKGKFYMRVLKNGKSYITDNGNEIIDIKNLSINNPCLLEKIINSWSGVVAVGLFSKYMLDVCILSSVDGIKVINSKNK